MTENPVLTLEVGPFEHFEENCRTYQLFLAPDDDGGAEISLMATEDGIRRWTEAHANGTTRRRIPIPRKQLPLIIHYLSWLLIESED